MMNLITLIPNIYKDEGLFYFHKIKDLLRAAGIEVRVPEDYRSIVKEGGVSFSDSAKGVDMIVVIGRGWNHFKKLDQGGKTRRSSVWR